MQVGSPDVTVLDWPICGALFVWESVGAGGVGFEREDGDEGVVGMLRRRNLGVQGV